MQIIGNRILIEPVEVPSTGLIQVPDKSKAISPVGKVLVVGNGREIEPEIQVGATVFVDLNYGHVAYAHEGKLCRIVSTKDVMLVLE